MMIFERMIESILVYGQKDKRRYRKSRKIFERGARSGRETPGYMVREEWRKRGIG
jgi:hypothetical protein